MSWHVADIDEANAVEPVTQAEVDNAEQEAGAAEAAVGQLEQRVIDGDESITPEQIEQQRGLSRFARLRAKSVERKAERARQAARLKACDMLRQDIEAHSLDVGKNLAKALRKAEAALTDFYKLALERDQAVGDWAERALRLNLPRHMSKFQPGKQDAHLGLNELYLIAGRRRVGRGPVMVDEFVKMMVRRAEAVRYGREPRPGDLYDRVSQVDAHESADPPPDSLFFKAAETGMVHVFGPDNRPSEVAISAGRLVEISRREAERLAALPGEPR